MLVATLHGATSIITGNITDAQGNPVNGTLVMRLPIPAQDPATQSAIAPIPVTFQLVNGQVQGGLPLYDLATIQPQKLWYSARAYDTTGKLVFYGNYYVTGAAFNIGAATPTVVTTSNISFAQIPSGGGGGASGFVVPSPYPTISGALAAAQSAHSGPVTVLPTSTDTSPFTNPTNIRVQNYKQTAGIDSFFFRDASEWGVKHDAIQLHCTWAAGSTTLTCSTATFTSGDIGKTVILYGAGAQGDHALSSGYTYVSGGSAPAGYPGGAQQQLVTALNGGTSGAACTTPPVGVININNGVPTGDILLYWGGDGCVTSPTSWQISGFTGTSTFTAGLLNNKTLITTIASVINSTQVTMAAAAVSNAQNPLGSQTVYGTDDTVAWNNLAKAFANHQGNAHITWTGGSIISNTIQFENWSGELMGSGKGNDQIGFSSGLGSTLFWASNTPGGVMIDNAGGSGMCYKDFTFIGNSTAPPVALQLSGFDTANAQLGAANCAENLTFGLNYPADPGIASFSGGWPILTGIKGNTVPGNSDFQRLCYGNGCTFNSVKYPVDKNNDQAVGWEWGTVRTFNAYVGFCSVGQDHVQNYEGAFVITDIHLGTCQYPGVGTDFFSNAVFDSVGSDGDPKLLDTSTGQGSITINGGSYGFNWIKNDGVVMDGTAAGNVVTLKFGTTFTATGTSGFSGFPVPQFVTHSPSPTSYGIFGNIPLGSFPIGNFPPQSASLQYQATPPLVGQYIRPNDDQIWDIHVFPTGTDYVDLTQHHFWYDTAGLTQQYGTNFTRKISAPLSAIAGQIPGATAGSTTYQYAIQSRLNNWGRNTGSVGSALFVLAPLTTGSATLTPVNANGINLQSLITGADGYYVYLFTGGAYKCLAKSGACVEFTTKTPLGYIAIDDGSYTYLTTPDRDGTGVSNVDNGIQIAGADFAGFKPLGTPRGTPQLTDFSTKQAADGQFPIYNFATKTYVPSTNVPQMLGMVSTSGGVTYTGGYSTVGASTALSGPNTLGYVGFTPTAPSTIVDGKVYIGATVTGSAMWAVYDSDGIDLLSNPNAPGSFLCGDATGVALSGANSFNIVTTSATSNCPVFTTGHKYFFAVAFSGSPSIRYDSPGFSGTSYYGSSVSLGGTFPASVSGTSNENANITSQYVDLITVYTLQAKPVGGSCAMSAATTCTFTIPASFTATPLSTCSIDAASTVPATANSCKCSVSGTTGTITAGISNSLTWDCILAANPN